MQRNYSNPGSNWLGKWNRTPNFLIPYSPGNCALIAPVRLGNLKHLRRGIVGFRHVELACKREIVVDDYCLMGRRRSVSPMKMLDNRRRRFNLHFSFSFSFFSPHRFRNEKLSLCINLAGKYVRRFPLHLTLSFIFLLLKDSF